MAEFRGDCEVKQRLGLIEKQLTPETFEFEKDGFGQLLSPGDYVEVLLREGGPSLAVIEDLRGNRAGYCYSCRFVAQVSPQYLIDCVVQPASTSSLQGLFRPDGSASLLIGELSALDEHVLVGLRTDKLYTHSCVFGASGFGKSTLLGLLVEEILLNISDVQIVIFDPHSDFRNFNEIKTPDVINESENRCATIDPNVIHDLQQRLLSEAKELISPPQLSLRRFDPPAFLDAVSRKHDPAAELLLWLLWDALEQPATPPTPAAMLDLVIKLAKDRTSRDVSGLDSRFQLPGKETDRALVRLQSLLRRTTGPVWAPSPKDSLDVLTASQVPRLVQFDLGALPFSDRALFAECALRLLWQRNSSTLSPHTFVVIDEAHNLCPARAEYTWQRNTLEWVNRFAGEGRKYRLHLIVVSQRPAKLHPSTLDNCRNYVVLRLQNRDDIDRLSRSTVHVSPSLLSRVGVLAPHEALIFGEFSPPVIARTGRRRMN
ncbi:MAG: ATP-binding protein [Candidatus Binatia bacterium]